MTAVPPSSESPDSSDPLEPSESRFRIRHLLQHRQKTGAARWGRPLALALLAFLWLYTMRNVDPTPAPRAEVKLDNRLWAALLDEAARKGRLAIPQQPARLMFGSNGGLATGGFVAETVFPATGTAVIGLRMERGRIGWRLVEPGGSLLHRWTVTVPEPIRDAVDTAFRAQRCMWVAEFDAESSAPAERPDTDGRLTVRLRSIAAWRLLDDGSGVPIGPVTILPSGASIAP